MALTYSLQRSQGYAPAQRLTGGTLPETALVPISLMPATFLPLHPIMHSSFFPFSFPFILRPIMHPRNNQQTSLATTTSTTFIFSSYSTIYYFTQSPLFYLLSYWYCMNVKSSNLLDMDITLSLCFKGEQETRLLLTLTKATSSHTHTHTHLIHPNHAAASAPLFGPP